MWSDERAVVSLSVILTRKVCFTSEIVRVSVRSNIARLVFQCRHNHSSLSPLKS